MVGGGFRTSGISAVESDMEVDAGGEDGGGWDDSVVGY
jgi:hypothetical protein